MRPAVMVPDTPAIPINNMIIRSDSEVKTNINADDSRKAKQRRAVAT